MDNKKVRVRFAPSPTGFAHIGNIRTAVFDYLLARHTGGTFILRVEDTDRARFVEGSIEEIMYDLRWLEMQWDEGPEAGGDYGPYFQSERLDIYKKYADHLVESGNAYYCFCTPERLAELRKQQEANKQSTGYDRHCRSLTRDEAEKAMAEGKPYVVRLAMPTEGTTTFSDVIRGEISFENSLQDDFVLLKSDGFPTYNFANVIDDHLMEITHVIRGEEFISSTPKHLHLYQALGWDPPALAHPSLILGPDRSKLSKRHGAVNFASYIEEGYLPDALLNFLVLLGWSAGEDREIYSREELIEKFALEGITDHPAVFDAQKLLWMNGVYIRQTPLDKLTEMILPFLKKAGMIPENPTQELLDYINRVMPLEQERMKLLSEAPELLSFFLKDKPEYDPKGARKWLASDNAPELLNAVADRLQALDIWAVESLETAVRDAGESLGAEGGKVIHPVRMAATGKTVGPGLFETLEVLGKDRVVSRLRYAAEQDWQKELE